jgi:hypothetical protein
MTQNSNVQMTENLEIISSSLEHSVIRYSNLFRIYLPASDASLRN